MVQHVFNSEDDARAYLTCPECGNADFEEAITMCVTRTEGELRSLSLVSDALGRVYLDTEYHDHDDMAQSDDIDERLRCDQCQHEWAHHHNWFIANADAVAELVRWLDDGAKGEPPSWASRALKEWHQALNR